VASPSSGNDPLLVRIDASGSVDPDGVLQSFRFDFGDGTSFSQGYPVLTHTYKRGHWTATLTVTDADGAVDSAKATISVNFTNKHPIAAMVCTPTSGKVPLRVTLDGTSSIDPDGQI